MHCPRIGQTHLQVTPVRPSAGVISIVMAAWSILILLRGVLTTNTWSRAVDNLAFDEKPDGSQDVPDADQREKPVVSAGAETSAGDDVR